VSDIEQDGFSKWARQALRGTPFERPAVTVVHGLRRLGGSRLIERVQEHSDAQVRLEQLFAAADDAVASNPEEPLSRWFASWPLDAYAKLYLTDLTDYPALRERLPRMPSAEAQRQWTGNEGRILMGQSVAFTRGVETAFRRYTGRPLLGATALDYGAGWGRLTRMFLRIIPDDQMFATDPAVNTADLFDTLGFRQKCVRVEAVPNELPWAAGSFDLAWLFSVLTHLPQHAADAIMTTLRPVVKDTGLLVVTLRPVAYWEAQGESELVAEHARRGFAHRPASELWGDTSMSLEYLTSRWPWWEIVGSGIQAVDPMQLVVYLRGR